MSGLWGRKKDVQAACRSRFSCRRRILILLVNVSRRKLIILRPCSESIRKTLDIVKTMLELADEGDAVREDVGCGILYAVLRDSAYKIKKLAEAEREAHSKKGWWEEH